MGFLVLPLLSLVTRWAQQSKLPSVRTPGGDLRFHAAYIRSLLNEGQRERHSAGFGS
jgi:hypothetical protein